MLGLLEEAEEVFDLEFDALPPPALEGRPFLDVDFDSGASAGGAGSISEAIPPPQACTVWFRSETPFRHLPQMETKIRSLLDQNPFTTLQIILETRAVFPFDVFKGLRAACRREKNIYLDRFYEFTPGQKPGAQRLVTLFPAEARAEIDREWVEDSAAHADVAWGK
jgi:hypothetical protein